MRITNEILQKYDKKESPFIVGATLFFNRSRVRKLVSLLFQPESVINCNASEIIFRIFFRIMTKGKNRRVDFLSEKAGIWGRCNTIVGC